MPEFDWDSIKDIIPDRDAKPPKPAFTAYDFMEQRGVSRDSASGVLDGLVQAGTLKSGKFWNAERSRWLLHYWKP